MATTTDSIQPTKPININLNDKIAFRVTPTGVHILELYTYEDYDKHTPELKDYIDKTWEKTKRKIDKDEYIYEQLWKVMTIFGQHLDGNHTPIETTILLTDFE